MNFLGAYLGSTHRTTGNKQILSRVEVEDTKASDNQRKLHGTRAWRFSRASKVGGLEVDMKRDTAKSAKPSPGVSIRKSAGAQSVREKAKLTGYILTALLTVMQNTEKNLLGDCAILHVTVVTA